MSRILACIESQDADNYHKVGQELLIPFSLAFGHSFRVISDGQVKKLNANNAIRKIIILCIAVLIFPVTLIAEGIGCGCLLMSNSHKKQYSLIQEQFHEFAPSFSRATDSVESYNRNELKNICDALINSAYYRTLVPSSVYQIKTEFVPGATVADTCYPKSADEVAFYEQKMSSIVNAVRLALEDQLNRAVKISEVLAVLEANHNKLFPVCF